MIADSNYDDMTLTTSDDREFKNQFTEFLKQKFYLKKKTLNSHLKKKKKRSNENAVVK